MRIVTAVAVLSALVAGPLLAEGVDICYNPNPCPTPFYHALRGDLPGLTYFEQGYYSSDHNVERIRLYPKRQHWGNFLDPALVAGLEDVNGDDLWWTDVRWLDLRQYALRSTTGSCTGTCNLPIPALPAGDSIVLMGFDLGFTDGSDHFLEEIAIVPEPQLGFISVTFTDESRDRPFRATVYYARLVALEIEAINSRSGHRVAGVPTGSRTAGTALLRGFRLAFTNGDHRLRKWGAGTCREEDCSVDDRWFVAFEDQNGDDPYDYWLSWTLLRD